MVIVVMLSLFSQCVVDFYLIAWLLAFGLAWAVEFSRDGVRKRERDVEQSK